MGQYAVGSCGASSERVGFHFLKGGVGGRLVGEKALLALVSLAIASVNSTGAGEDVWAGTPALSSGGGATLYNR